MSYIIWCQSLRRESGCNININASLQWAHELKCTMLEQNVCKTCSLLQLLYILFQIWLWQ